MWGLANKMGGSQEASPPHPDATRPPSPTGGEGKPAAPAEFIDRALKNPRVGPLPWWERAARTRRVRGALLQAGGSR
jgi:hypothetical protein